MFYQGTYAQVLNDAKHELKFLAVYLHSESSSETANFCRNTLADSEVIEFVNSNMLFWASDVSTPEGYRVSHSINTRSHPAVVIVGIREHKMVIMGRMEGFCTAPEFLRRLQAVINDNKIWLTQARQERYAKLNLLSTIKSVLSKSSAESEFNLNLKFMTRLKKYAKKNC